MIHDLFIMIPYPKLQYTTQTHQTKTSRYHILQNPF